MVPALSWLVARIKSRFQSCRVSRFQSEERQSQTTLKLRNSETLKPAFRYAVLLGRIVKSRNWVRTLDICIPFSCETNGRISAINWSFISSLISSWRVFSPPLK